MVGATIYLSSLITNQVKMHSYPEPYYKWYEIPRKNVPLCCLIRVGGNSLKEKEKILGMQATLKQCAAIN